jgi:hypothetical protein
VRKRDREIYMKNEIAKLMAKPMDRKGFLQHLGIVALAVTGVTGLLAALSRGIPSETQRSGYGGSPELPTW